MLIEYFRLRHDVKPPVRANPSDAGLDVFFCPPEYIEGRSLAPGGNMLFETGLKFGIPHGYALMVCNRSGMAAKKSLVYGAHLIDSGYDGEVFIDLHNIGTEIQTIKPGEKIAQLVMVPVISFRAVETSEDNLYGWYPITVSDRGAAGFGSSDRK